MPSMHGRYENDINRVFRRYALIPIAILLLVSYAAVLFIFFQTSRKTNRAACISLTEKLESVLSSYMEEAEILSKDRRVTDTVSAGKADRSVYDRLYSFVNSQPVRMDFFIFDSGHRLIYNSLMSPPAYAGNEGFSARSRKNQGNVMLSVEGSDSRVLVISCLFDIGDSDHGLLLFEMGNSQFDELCRDRESVDLLLTNPYHQVCFSTNAYYTDRYGKIGQSFREQKVLLGFRGPNYTVYRTELPFGGLSVTAITALGDYPRSFTILGAFLASFFILLLICIILSSRIVTHQKTKVIDELYEAITYVQAGDFSHPVLFKTGDEFEQIADAYNMMLKDIQRLMRENQERAYLLGVSELKQLEAQFNPHFLFNTLEVIRYNLYLAPGTVEKTIMDLASILRYSLNTGSYVTLREDMQYVESYLNIQYLRYEGRIQADIRIDEDAYDIPIPKLIVQPVLENAFKYGFHGQDSFRISLHAYVKKDWLIIWIANDGKPIEESQLQEIRTTLKMETNSSGKFGLYSVNRRIALMYGEEYGLTIDSKEGETAVTLTLPARGGQLHV